jgi:hypothetical protein
LESSLSTGGIVFPPTFKKIKIMSARIEVIRAYRDVELSKFVQEGEIFEVSDERATLLAEKKFIRILEVKEDIELKEEKPVVKTKELKTAKKTK